jgi:hypothetical protein
MLEIPEMTLGRLLDERLTCLRPLYIEKVWEVYLIRQDLRFDGFSFKSGMIVERTDSSIATVYDDQINFLAHLRASSIELPIELRSALTVGMESIVGGYTVELQQPEG